MTMYGFGAVPASGGVYQAGEIQSALFLLGYHRTDPFDPGALVDVPQWDFELEGALLGWSEDQEVSVSARPATREEVREAFFADLFNPAFPGEFVVVDPVSSVDLLLDQAAAAEGAPRPETVAVVQPAAGETVEAAQRRAEEQQIAIFQACAAEKGLVEGRDWELRPGTTGTGTPLPALLRPILKAKPYSECADRAGFQVGTPKVLGFVLLSTLALAATVWLIAETRTIVSGRPLRARRLRS